MTETSPFHKRAEQRENHRWKVLLTLCTAFLMFILDGSIVNVALPSIRDDLGLSQANLVWVINAYLVPFGGLLLLSGRLGDLIGRKRMFISGLSVFITASLLCGLAQNQALLLSGRFFQGVGAAMSAAVILSIIVTLFPEPAGRARAIGVYAFVGAAGAAVGLLAGGALTQAVGWHWIFFINLPLGLVTVLAAAKLIENDLGSGFGRGADIAGALLLVSALMLGVYTIVGASEYGWGSTRTFFLGGVAALLLAGFVVREALTLNPLVPLRIFRSRNLLVANVVQLLLTAGGMGQFFLGALYLQRVLGFSSLEVGLSYLPVSLTIGTFALLVSSRLVVRFGPKVTLLTGLGLFTLGLILLVRLPVEGSYVFDVLPAFLLLGSGFGLSSPALATLAMSGAEAQDVGLASGLINTTQEIGSALGVAILGTLATLRNESLLSGNEALAVALTAGYRFAFTVAVGFSLTALTLAATLLKRR